ncbi:DUF1349 domain-containing protein [Neisseriaceae bacterium TC5R-5]|nr:DUF1349 domain-containing protein [Neisseriaceae bacterium TC5R-5]
MQNANILSNEANTMLSNQTLFQNNRKSPLYWSPYEYCFSHNSFIPEAEWKANIDWVANNLLSYGYKMVCIDGWGDVDHNEFGYRTRHSAEWKNNYAWWSQYLHNKGMEFGIYDNPLWINRAAANSGIKIKGTNIPLSSIMNVTENARSFTWVQVDRPGAEEYVKGYIQHYAAMNVKFLRVDFLSWYETGYDKNFGYVGIQNRPHSHYDIALRWMREECDTHGIFLSLAMPNLTNDGATESKYADMIRINEDCNKGTWERFSYLKRGQKFDGWSQYENAMDGFAYFSKISGRGKILLDGDFIRLHTFTNDDEKKSVISMHLVAGGPLSIADQANTIGANLWFYQNRELLALNEDGFVGMPLSYDPKSVNSQIWRGQLSNGDWIVTLFNRENTVQTRNISFYDIGIKGYATVRDLWQHKDLTAEMDNYSINIAPHACVVLRIRPSTNPENIIPDPWKRIDIGVGGGIVSYQSSNAQFSVQGAGKDIEGTQDEFNFVYQEIYGDVEFSARIKSLDLVNPWSKAGLMIRSSTANNASNAMIALTAANGVSFQSRITSGQATKAIIASSLSAEIWLKIRRQGNSISAYYSENNNTWLQIGATTSINMPDKVYVGMAVTSHDANKSTKAVFQEAQIKRALPLPWKKVDIGNLRIASSFLYEDISNTFTLQAAGADIEGTNDEFCFIYKEISENITITTQVVSLDNTNNWAKAGLMIRSSLAANTSNAMLAITAGSGISFQHRKADGQGTNSFITGGQAASIWLRLVKAGNLFTAYYSKDNISWLQLGTSQFITVSDKAYIGLAVTSHDVNKLTKAVFKNVEVK